MRSLRADYGLSELNDNILAGKKIENLATTEEMLDWFWAIKRPEEALTNPPVTGVITKDEYQDMFKNAREKLIRRTNPLHTVENTSRAR